MKRLFCLLMVFVLCLPVGSVIAEENKYETLSRGDRGPAVDALKKRMYELGYFNSTNFSVIFNETTETRLKELQEKNGLKADGIATPEVQELIFSEECLSKSATPRPKITPSPAPLSTQIGYAEDEKQPGEISLLSVPEGAPALDADGYLPEGQEPYILSDRSAGIWSYISQTLHIEIRQKSAKGPLLWLEAYVCMKDPASMASLLSSGKKPGVGMVLPSKILSEHQDTILAFNDDFFGYRNRYGGKIGVIIRNGKILYDQPKKSSSTVFPPLDIMAVFEDGSMKTFISDEYSAQEYLDMGVRDTYAFGPILVKDGKKVEEVSQWGTTPNPRMAFGITANGTLVVLDVLGRRKDAKGVTIEWVADKMMELGCVEALNLDGGNTTCMVFMGDMINRTVNVSTKDIRYISGLIGIGEYTE